MESTRNEVSAYLENILLLMLGLLLLLFPLVFTSATTDPYSLPKQTLVAVLSLASLLLLGAKMISDRTLRLRRTPLDMPVLLLLLVSFLSAFFAVNRYDALTALVPFFLAIVTFYIIVNVAKTYSSFLFLSSALVLGASLSAMISILSFLNIYVIPLPGSHYQTFNTFGSLLDQALYFGFVLIAVGYLGWPIVKTRDFSDLKRKHVGFLIGFLLLCFGFGLTLYEIVVKQPLLLLPFETGFQTAFAAISQDTGRVLQGFLFGSGFGTYLVDFSRFKQPTYNLNQTLWTFSFFRSSSFVLELFATTGLLGLLAYLFVIFRVLKGNGRFLTVQSVNPFFIAILLVFITSFLVPFSPTVQTVLFLLLGLFVSSQGLHNHAKYYDVIFYFLASRKSILPIVTYPVAEHQRSDYIPPMAKSDEEKSFTRFLPVSYFLLSALIVGYLGYNIYRFIASDMKFQQSLVAASANNGLETYNDETNAISLFPYRESYHRIYSQTNLALANSIANATQSSNATPSAQTQQTILTLIQQSINSARLATTVSPQTSLDWQNLSQIYRSLIGVGRNADQFSILAMQQAIILDPNNPQLYLNLGGIYYQLQQWDQAQNQFQVATRLKPDFANAYYNLGHALEQKGDLKTALTQYQIVKSLVTSDPNSSKQIDKEIKALQDKIGKAQNGPTPTPPVNASTSQPPLQISTPSAQLPERKPPIQIPPPPSTTASPSAR